MIRSIRMAMWLAALMVAAIGVEVRAQEFKEFSLSGNQEKNVTTYYNSGTLYDYSLARVFSGGSVDSLSAWNTSTVGISGGTVSTLQTWDNSNLTVSGGLVSSLHAHSTSRVRVSGGTIYNFYALNLRSGPENCVTITAGSVGNLHAGITLTGHEHFSLNAHLTLSELTPYGMQAAVGTINYVSFQSLTARDTSSVAISGGKVNRLDAFDTSSVSVSGGDIGGLHARNTSGVFLSSGSLSDLSAWDSSNVSVFGGNVTTLSARNTSSVQVSGGSIKNLSVHDLRSGANNRVIITAGSVETLYASIIVAENEHFSLNAPLRAADLTQYGVQVADGTVNDVLLQSLYVRQTGSISFSANSVGIFDTYDSSSVAINGGSVNNLIGRDTSNHQISGGNLRWIHAFDSSRVAVSGGSLAYLHAGDNSNVTFIGKDFRLGHGLWQIGDELFGSGTLSGQWMDGTSWTTYITVNHPTATILLIPDPATLLLLGLGGLALRHRVRL